MRIMAYYTHKQIGPFPVKRAPHQDAPILANPSGRGLWKMPLLQTRTNPQPKTGAGIFISPRSKRSSSRAVSFLKGKDMAAEGSFTGSADTALGAVTSWPFCFSPLQRKPSAQSTARSAIRQGSLPAAAICGLPTTPMNGHPGKFFMPHFGMNITKQQLGSCRIRQRFGRGRISL